MLQDTATPPLLPSTLPMPQATLDVLTSLTCSANCARRRCTAGRPQHTLSHCLQCLLPCVAATGYRTHLLTHVYKQRNAHQALLSHLQPAPAQHDGLSRNTGWALARGGTLKHLDVLCPKVLVQQPLPVAQGAALLRAYDEPACAGVRRTSSCNAMAAAAQPAAAPALPCHSHVRTTALPHEQRVWQLLRDCGGHVEGDDMHTEAHRAVGARSGCLPCWCPHCVALWRMHWPCVATGACSCEQRHALSGMRALSSGMCTCVCHVLRAICRATIEPRLGVLPARDGARGLGGSARAATARRLVAHLLRYAAMDGSAVEGCIAICWAWPHAGSMGLMLGLMLGLSSAALGAGGLARACKHVAWAAAPPALAHSRIRAYIGDTLAIAAAGKACASVWTVSTIAHVHH